MKKLLVLFLLLFAFSNSWQVLASSARSVVETQVESSGETKVYQSVETTVDGQTVKKESSQPGKLELEMKKNNGEIIVSTPTPTQPPISFVSQLIEFFRKLLSDLTSWFK